MSYLEAQGRGGLLSWLSSTDHKRIALLYLFLLVPLFWVAVSLGFAMRLKHLFAGDFLMSAQTYNALFTVHGVIMIFMFVIPGAVIIITGFPSVGSAAEAMRQTAQEWEKITQRRGRDKQLPWLKIFHAGFAASEPGAGASR